MAGEKEIIEFLKAYHGAVVKEITQDDITTSVLLHPSGLTAQPVTNFTDKLLPIPRRKHGAFNFQDLTDLIGYTEEHAKAYTTESAGSSKDDPGHPHIFVDANSGKVSVVFNHHRPIGGGQAHGDHRAIYVPKFSPQWDIWTAKREPMGAGDFADFVDDNIEDIGPEPDKGDKSDAGVRLTALAKLYGTNFATREELIALSKGIRIHAKDNIEQIVNPQTGEVAFNFTSDHTAKDAKGGALKIPGLFILQIPVFDKGFYFRLPVRLKYRAAGGSVVWSFKIINLEKAKETAIADIRETVESGTALPTFFGTP